MEPGGAWGTAYRLLPAPPPPGLPPWQSCLAIAWALADKGSGGMLAVTHTPLEFATLNWGTWEVRAGAVSSHGFPGKLAPTPAPALHLVSFCLATGLGVGRVGGSARTRGPGQGPGGCHCGTDGPIA